MARFHNFFSVLVENKTENNELDDKYKAMARNHVDSYFEMLKTREPSFKEAKSNDDDFIGQRETWKQSFQHAPRGKMLDFLVFDFFEQMLEKYQEFKGDFCSGEATPDSCKILNQNDSLQELLNQVDTTEF